MLFLIYYLALFYLYTNTIHSLSNNYVNFYLLITKEKWSAAADHFSLVGDEGLEPPTSSV